MKKLFLLFILALSVSGLFAKDKNLYTKKWKNGVIELYESEETPKYYISIYEKGIEEYNNCIINCDDKDKITEFLYYLINNNVNGYYYVVLYYELTHEELKLTAKKNELVNKTFEHRTMYYLK